MNTALDFDWPAILSVLSASAIGVAIPGANFVAITNMALTASRVEAICMSAGIAVVNSLWAACGILGASVILVRYAWLGMVLKNLGCAYLIWFGLRLLISAPQIAPVRAIAHAAANRRSAFTQGISLNLVNPKSLLYYCAVLSNLVPASSSGATIGTMLVAVGLCALLWYGTLGHLLSLPGVSAHLRHGLRTINRLCGALLIGIGLFEIIGR